MEAISLVIGVTHGRRTLVLLIQRDNNNENMKKNSQTFSNILTHWTQRVTWHHDVTQQNKIAEKTIA